MSVGWCWCDRESCRRCWGLRRSWGNGRGARQIRSEGNSRSKRDSAGLGNCGGWRASDRSAIQTQKHNAKDVAGQGDDDEQSKKIA